MKPGQLVVLRDDDAVELARAGARTDEDVAHVARAAIHVPGTRSDITERVDESVREHRGGLVLDGARLDRDQVARACTVETGGDPEGRARAEGRGAALSR